MKISDMILYSFLKGLQKVVEALPGKLVLPAGVLAGHMAYLFLPRRRNITVNNIRRAFPGKSYSWCRLTALKVFRNFGRNIIEMIKFSAGRFSHMVEVSGIDKIDGGGVLMMGHLGHWEITGMSVASSGRDIFPVGRRIHNKAFDRIVNDLRTSFGGGHIPYRRGMREVLRKLSEKKNVCVLVDQRIKKGLPVLFFNRPVRATHLVSVLSRKAKIVSGYSRHDDEGKIRVYYENPPEMVDTGNSLKSDFINTQRQMDWIQKLIEEKPDEWFWMHNFWKDRWGAVFLDRDGTINFDRGYVSSRKQFEVIPGALEGMRRLRKAGYLLVVVTNQSGIARGYYTEKDYIELNRYMLDLFKSEGVIVDRVYHCPHHPDDGCGCRKPGAGMVRRALKELNIDLKKSFVVGDKESDMLLGEKLGMKRVMVGNERKKRKLFEEEKSARDLKRAAEIIINGF